LHRNIHLQIEGSPRPKNRNFGEDNETNIPIILLSRSIGEENKGEMSRQTDGRRMHSDNNRSRPCGPIALIEFYFFSFFLNVVFLP
jgi:hypothetical protein